ncbi:DUF1496 domain-containing protein [Citrobacter freundii]|nr:DUF1496 domain-containing protein [Citrobacter freundii]
MKSFILAGLLILPFVVGANSIQASQAKQDSDKPTLRESKQPIKQSQNICMYENKAYTEGAVINDSGALLQCVNNNKTVLLDGGGSYDMSWERVPDQK